MRQTVLVFSAIAVSLLILLNLRKLSVMHGSENQELWTALFGLLFVVIGAILSRILWQRRSQDTPAADPVEALQKLGITQREYEVLQLVARGLSNQEISVALFISESTVKTHVSNVMMKLDARRRTQAVQRAKELHLL